MLRIELDACKQELELERSRSQMLLHRYKDIGKNLFTSELSVVTADIIS